MSFVIHINGWPGSGKLTIARRLSEKLNARLIDNHTLINPARALFSRDDPLFWSLRERVRELVLEYASKVPTDTPIIFTNALSDDSSDQALFDAITDFASARGGRLFNVVLHIEPEENTRRLQEPSRQLMLKLMDPENLAMLREKYSLRVEPGSIAIDVTDLSAEEAAERLKQAILAA